MTRPLISQKAVDLIVECEVTSRAVYEKKYEHPEWPGGASGVTIAIGYDLGYADNAKIIADWNGLVGQATLAAMQRCSGVHGDAAKQLLPSVRSQILILWDSAISVFMNRDVPEWTDRVCRSIPGADRLSPDCLGALVSLAYNRGASFDSAGARYTEMRAVKKHVMTGELSLVPGDIRAMKRLWPDMRGLRDRRDAEAALFQQGLTTISLPAIVPSATPTRQLKPPKASAEEHGSATATATATAGAAKTAADSGASSSQIVFIVIAGIVVSVVVWFAVRAYRSRQVTARAKDAPT